MGLTRIVTPRQPTASERETQWQVADIVKQNIKVLAQHERIHPDAAPRAIRKLSMLTGGSANGLISRFATEFAHPNVFGKPNSYYLLHMFKLTVAGGHHSIGSLLTWLLIELDRHANSYEKLMTEIHDVDPLDAGFLGAKTPYLDAILNEANRLYPTVHTTVRVINREVALTTGSKTPVIFKPGMLVYLSHLHLYTSTEYWGVDAKEYIPERFLEGNAARNPTFMPFGSGSRSCVGTLHGVRAPVLTCVGWIQVREPSDQGVPGELNADMYYQVTGKRPRHPCPIIGGDKQAGGRYGKS
jgi:hypothetical protein